MRNKKRYEFTTTKGKVVRRWLTDKDAEARRAEGLVLEELERTKLQPNRAELRAEGHRLGRYRIPRRMPRRNGKSSLATHFEFQGGKSQRYRFPRELLQSQSREGNE